MEEVVEVIREGEIVRMPESRAIEEDLFILRKVIEPREEPSQQPVPFRPRLSPEVPKGPSYLESWSAGGRTSRKNIIVKDLIDNFHWKITRQRRMKDITRKQLAEAVGASEEEIKMIEFGELPRDDFILISQIESHLGISLRKENKPADVSVADLHKMKEDRVRDEIDKLQKKERQNVSGDEIEIEE